MKQEALASSQPVTTRRESICELLGEPYDPARWNEFRRRYAAELDRNRDALQELLGMAGTVTLLFAARDPDKNNAVALAEWLRDQNSAS